MPCYDFAPIIGPTLSPTVCRDFGYYRLSWRDGRCVQNPRTYSPRHIWFAITSDSSFMKANCSLQSELRIVLMGLAPSCDLAAHCTIHCSTCVAQGVRGPCWLDVIPAFLLVIRGSLIWLFNISWGLRSLKDLTRDLTTRADDSHAAPDLAPSKEATFLWLSS